MALSLQEHHLKCSMATYETNPEEAKNTFICQGPNKQRYEEVAALARENPETPEVQVPILELDERELETANTTSLPKPV